MFYTKYILVLSIALLTGCAQTGPVKQATETQQKQDSPTSAAEIQLYRSALTSMDDGNLPQAEQSLKRFTRKQPQLAGPWANLGLIYLKQDRLQEAEQSLEKAYQLNPKMPQVNNLLGIIKNREGKIKEAEKYYLTAIEYKPDYILAHYNLALLYDIYMQDISKAISHYRTYLQLSGNKDQKTMDWLAQLESSQR